MRQLVLWLILFTEEMLVSEDLMATLLKHDENWNINKSDETSNHIWKCWLRSLALSTYLDYKVESGGGLV